MRGPFCLACHTAKGSALRWGCGGGVGSSMAWGYPPALWLSLVCGSLCDVLWSGDVLRAGDTWQGKRLSLLQGKRRSTVWGCLLDVGMVYGQGLADGSSLLPGGLSLLMAGPACGIKKFFQCRRWGQTVAVVWRKNRWQGLRFFSRVTPKEKSTHSFCCKCLIFLAPRDGLEPPT